MTVQNRFDFTELDPETPHFHLMIQPAQEIEVAIRSTAHLVTGPVEPPSRLSAEGVRHESLRCEIRTPQVAPGHAGTSEEQLAWHTDRDSPHALVQHERGTVCNRTSEGDRPP